MGLCGMLQGDIYLNVTRFGEIGCVGGCRGWCSKLHGVHLLKNCMGGRVACLDVRRGFWWGNLKERYHLGYTDVRGENNIKIDIKETGWGGVDWIHVAQEKDK